MIRPPSVAVPLLVAAFLCLRTSPARAQETSLPPATPTPTPTPSGPEKTGEPAAAPAAAAPTSAPAAAAPTSAPAAADAQRVTLSGELKVKGSGAPLKKATAIQADDRENNAQADARGRFTLSLPRGEQKVIFRAEGFDDLEMSVVDGKPAEDGPWYLEPSAELTRLGVIRARRKVEVSQQSLQREELERIPGTGGDAVRGLQTLPSVIAANPGSADITVRGSAPGDNRFFVDKMEVPFVFHLGGLGTVVPTRMLEGVDLYPGGWSSVFNDATGGVIQLRTENSIPERMSGQFELGLTQSSVYLEGNLFGDADTGPLGAPPSGVAGASNSTGSNSTGSVAPSGTTTAREDDRVGYRLGLRRTYLEIFSPVIKKFVDEEQVSIVTLPQATDYQMILNGNHSSGTWQTYLIGASNRLAAAASTSLSSDEDGKTSFSLFNYFSTMGARWNSNLGNGWGLTVAPQYRYLIIDQRFFDNKVKIVANKFALETALDKRFNSVVSATVGVRPEFEHLKNDVDAIQVPAGGFGPFFDADTAPRSKETRSREITSGSAYLDVSLRPVRPLTLNPGVAVLRGSWGHQVAVDPRFGTRFALTDQHTLKAAWGYYSQRPQPFFDAREYGNPDLDLERAVHYVTGIESKFGQEVETDFQVYHKDLLNFVGNATKEPAKKYENNVKGRSRGFEALVKKQRTGRWTGWVSYGYSRSERRDPKSLTWRPFDYDKPHSLNVIGAYKITGQWEASSKWQYQSGSSTSRIGGGRYNQNTGRYVPANVTADGTFKANDERLPATFQWDVRTDYDILYDTWKLRLYLEVLNVTNRQNVVGVDYSEDFSERVYVTGAPTIPSFGVIASF
jgi:hypothetical protein